MNERIKELALQAGAYFGESSKDYFGDVHPAFVNTEKIDLKKFAELIVKECAELTLDYKNDDHYNGWLDYRSEIKKHFGIKE